MALPDMEERMLLTEFRKRVSNVFSAEYHQDDPMLLRWLRARDNDLDRAELMLRTSIQWRLLNKVDTVRTRVFDSFFKTNYPFYINGVDRDGRPLLIMPLGRWDIRKAADAGRIDEFIDYTNYMLESMIHAILMSDGVPNDAKWPNTQMTYIIDWDGFAFGQLLNLTTAQNILKMVMVYEAHYPEILHHCFYINCSRAFQIFFKLMKPLLAARTMAKIYAYGSNPLEWEPELQKLIAPEQLPPYYGGTASMRSESLEQPRVEFFHANINDDANAEGQARAGRSGSI